MNSFLDADFQKALDALWQNKITHFGALSIYGDLVEFDVLRRVLQALKVVAVAVSASACIMCPTFYHNIAVAQVLRLSQVMARSSIMRKNIDKIVMLARLR